MIGPPPRLVRRVVVDPVVVAVCAAVVLVSPAIALGIAVPVSVLLRRRTPLGLVWLGVSLAAREVAGVVMLTGLWLATGCGLAVRSPWSQAAHYRVMRWWVDGLFDVATRGVGLRLLVRRPVLPDRPVVVLARHAGTGDSLLLVRTLLHLGRRPRLVIQAALQWDPCVDVIGHRVPTVFVPVQRRRRRGAIGDIERLASTMRGTDALVIFPEGGNYSPARHARAVRRLRAEGRHRLAARAERLVHLLPPKTVGPLAILRAAPDAPVVLAAHAGLDHLDSVTATVRCLPLARPVELMWRLVGRDEVPVDDEARVDWLFARWREMDAAVTAASGELWTGAAPGTTSPRRQPAVS